MVLFNVKRYGIILTIAVLFSVFSFSIIDLIIEQPEYSDYCNDTYRSINIKEEDCANYSIPQEDIIECNNINGNIDYIYESNCLIGNFCNTCFLEYDAAMIEHKRVGFIVTSLLGLISVISTLYITSKKEFIEWIYSGFMIGGIITIFIGTMSYFNYMNLIMKPFVMIAEIGLIIWVTIKTSTRNNKK